MQQKSKKRKKEPSLSNPQEKEGGERGGDKILKPAFGVKKEKKKKKRGGGQPFYPHTVSASTGPFNIVKSRTNELVKEEREGAAWSPFATGIGRRRMNWGAQSTVYQVTINLYKKGRKKGERIGYNTL